MQNTSVAERALSGRRSTRSERPAAAAAATDNECGAALGAPSTHARPPLSASGGGGDGQTLLWNDSAAAVQQVDRMAMDDGM